MMNTPQLAAQFLGVAIFDTARLAARWFIRSRRPFARECLSVGNFKQHQGQFKANIRGMLDAFVLKY
jgi:hypothetical protein